MYLSIIKLMQPRFARSICHALDCRLPLMVHFLGLDLAWRSTGNTTALAVLQGDAEAAQLVGLYPALLSDSDILAAVKASAGSNTVLAVDAPLIIENNTGQRGCERLIGQRFGHADASAHTSNLSLFPAARSVRLGKELEGSGWQHLVAPENDRQKSGRWFFEVYPHPAHVVLFDRERIVKYKKGTAAIRRTGLGDLRSLIREKLGAATPRLTQSLRLDQLIDENLELLRGAARKQYEDSLDAVLCAYLSAHYWTWGAERNEMIGSMTSGYIVVPSRTIAGAPWGFARHADRH